jgi:flagellin
MTRINTNVSSLVARNTLGRSNAALEQALTRLSTGLRINTGKDDPAGLIASENLRSDITSVKRAISNTDRANQVIATADSALGQVSSLLNDIRGLVTESANAGALSDAQIAANQAQIDSSLDALNRIAQTTTFQGRKLLDGSLDFTTTAGTNFSKLESLQIDQANLGSTGSVPVSINVADAATKAQVDVANVPTGSGTGVAASTTVSFNSQAQAGTAADGQVGFVVGTAASSGNITFNLGAIAATGNVALTNGTISITAATAGAAGNTTTLNVDVVDTTSSLGASYNSGTNTITVNADITNDASSWTVSGIAAAINALTEFNSAVVSGGSGAGVDQTVTNQTLAGGRNASTETIVVAGAAAGTSGNVSITIAESGNSGSSAVLSGSAGAGYTVTVDNSATIANIRTAVDSIAEVTATYTPSSGTPTYNASADAPPSALNLTNGAQTTNYIDIQSLATSAGSNLALTFTQGSSAGVSGSAGTYTITYTAGSSLNDILSQIETIAEVDDANTGIASGSNGTRNIVSAPAGVNSILGYTAPVFGDDVITIENDTVGTAGNGKTVTIVEGSSGFDATTGVGATADSNGNITVTLNSARTDISIANIANAINSLSGYSATVTSAGGSGAYDSTSQAPPSVANTANGAAAGGLAASVVIELAGLNGSEVLSFGAGTSLSQLVTGINLVKDATGVEATAAGTTLQLKSTEYGSDALVDLKVISEGSGSTVFGDAAARDSGTDIVATVNGVVANGKGNLLEINTATLDLKTSIEAGFEGQANFSIVGGGALFQLGPDVVSNQQARLGVTSVNTARLGGVSGKLYQLANGNEASLTNDPTTAARIVEEAIDQITSLRGRLGAFQRTTLETNKNALNDTLVNLSDAESSVRDADFAAESAALTRAQILVQSGTTVLQIANSNPQNVLALLR